MGGIAGKNKHQEKRGYSGSDAQRPQCRHATPLWRFPCESGRAPFLDGIPGTPQGDSPPYLFPKSQSARRYKGKVTPALYGTDFFVQFA
jgi:hypothetical protein